MVHDQRQAGRVRRDRRRGRPRRARANGRAGNSPLAGARRQARTARSARVRSRSGRRRRLERRRPRAPDVRDRLEAVGPHDVPSHVRRQGPARRRPARAPQHVGRIEGVRQIGRRHDDPRRARTLHRHDEQSQTPRQSVSSITCATSAAPRPSHPTQRAAAAARRSPRRSPGTSSPRASSRTCTTSRICPSGSTS